jgi:hypothetical protein
MDDFKRGLFKALSILEDYLQDIVIAGGWAPLIYYHYLLADKNLNPLRTKDIDILVPSKLKIIANKTIDELLIMAGLKSNFRSLHVPPVIHYEGKLEGREVELDFLTTQKNKAKNKVIIVQKGLHAQSLPFVSILLENTMWIKIDDYPLYKNKYLEIRVPTPAAYIFNKGLTFTRRNKMIKRAKDLYYILDIFVNCQELMPGIVEELERLNKNYPKKWFARFLTNLKKYFADESSYGIDLIVSQRPEMAFQDMNNEQFKHYALGVFQEFLKKISSMQE